MVQKVGDVVKVDGIMNIGSTYGVFFVALASLSGSLALTFNLPLPILNEKSILFILIIMAPIFTYMTDNQIQKNLEGYIECTSKNTNTLRYSNRTYVISPELCKGQ
ncbi:hypothetical protein CWO33_05175 [Vibrio splendidus]|nr:hypothetical protein CWO33_05175 [Vibrio splendidus]